MAKRILVCGGRDYDDYNALTKAIEAECEWSKPDDFGNTMPRGIIILHGCASGADSIADQWAVVNWVPMEEYRADWNSYGKSAGAIRNQQMLELGRPDLVIAAKGGRGTAHMVNIAERAGVPVKKVGW